MATTNFLQFNPTGANQDNDAQYLADALRTGGAPLDGVLPSKTFNKLEYQNSTFVAAFCQMLAAKGYSTSDADIAALAGVLANVVTDADLASGITTVAYATTVAFNATASNGFQVNLTGNITSSTISGVSPGQLLAFYFAQDAAGGRTVSWPPGMVGTLPPDPTPLAVSLILFRADASGTLRAVTPLISNNATYTGPLISTSFALAAGAPLGKILVGDGTHYSPQDYTVIRNGFGTFMKTPDGLGGFVYEAWGIVNAPATGGRQTSVAITFPASFPGTPALVVSGGSAPAVGHNDSMSVYSDGVNAAGATAWLNCGVNIGGSGAPGFNSSVPVHWHARY